MPIVLKQPKWQTLTLPIDTIRVDRDFQPRSSLINAEHVYRYMAAMETGADFPPIRVAKFDRIYHVVDGFHRLEAQRRRGNKTVVADVARMTRRDAVAFSLEANASNGIPFTRDDHRRIAQRYFTEGLHLSPSGERKSYRTIAFDLLPVLGKRLSQTTAGRYLELYAPKAPEPESDDGEEYPLTNDDTNDPEDEEQMNRLSDAQASLAHVMACYNSLTDGYYRHELRERLRNALASLEQLAEDRGEAFPILDI